jgi:hypothetical protein
MQRDSERERERERVRERARARERAQERERMIECVCLRHEQHTNTSHVQFSELSEACGLIMRAGHITQVEFLISSWYKFGPHGTQGSACREAL